MKKLSQLFGYQEHTIYGPDKSLLYNDLGIGIEIEAEGWGDDAAHRTRRPGFSSFWDVKRDGSLRNNGIELCSKVLFGGGISSALAHAAPVMELLEFNWRAGIHIHTDVSGRTVNDLIRICALYSVLEPLIFEWEGNQRDESNFCVPWYKCNSPLVAFLEAVSAGQREGDRATAAHLNNITRNGKYTALNLCPITNFGSIEFRHMQSTPDVDRIIQFINICSAINRKASEMKQPGGDMLSVVGEEAFLADTLGLPFLLDVPDYAGLLWQGVSTYNIIPTLDKDVKLSRLNNINDFPLV